MINLQKDTEAKIKEAAITLFTKKGYAATRTRDIAEVAGINLSLLNYYFRSKAKLFNIIMTEKTQQLFGVVFPIINDDKLSLEKKIENIVDRYVTIILKNPDLPIFVLSEIRNNTQNFSKNYDFNRIFISSSLVIQIKERNKQIDPFHFMMNILGLTVFPFITKPIITSSGIADDNKFVELMNERKKLIPLWIKSLLDS